MKSVSVTRICSRRGFLSNGPVWCEEVSFVYTLVICPSADVTPLFIRLLCSSHPPMRVRLDRQHNACVAFLHSPQNVRGSGRGRARGGDAGSAPTAHRSDAAEGLGRRPGLWTCGVPNNKTSKPEGSTYRAAAAGASVCTPVWAPSAPGQCSYWLSSPPSRPPSPPPAVCPSFSAFGCWFSVAAASGGRGPFLRLYRCRRRPHSGWEHRRCRCLHDGAPQPRAWQSPRGAPGPRRRVATKSPRIPRCPPGAIPRRESARRRREAGPSPMWRWRWSRSDPRRAGGADCSTAPWWNQDLPVSGISHKLKNQKDRRCAVSPNEPSRHWRLRRAVSIRIWARRVNEVRSDIC